MTSNEINMTGSCNKFAKNDSKWVKVTYISINPPERRNYRMDYNWLPVDIKDILKLLIEEKVVIVLRSGIREKVEVEAVIGDLLIAEEDGFIKFVDIDSIDEVIIKKECLERCYQRYQKQPPKK